MCGLVAQCQQRCLCLAPRLHGWNLGGGVMTCPMLAGRQAGRQSQGRSLASRQRRARATPAAVALRQRGALVGSDSESPSASMTLSQGPANPRSERAFLPLSSLAAWTPSIGQCAHGNYVFGFSNIRCSNVRSGPVCCARPPACTVTQPSALPNTPSWRAMTTASITARSLR